MKAPFATASCRKCSGPVEQYEGVLGDVNPLFWRHPDNALQPHEAVPADGTIRAVTR